jgi:hypothetical protein
MVKPNAPSPRSTPDDDAPETGGNKRPPSVTRTPRPQTSETPPETPPAVTPPPPGQPGTPSIG